MADDSSLPFLAADFAPAGPDRDDPVMMTEK
jgi:hypothetical protein